jgi:hypothetical protein
MADMKGGVKTDIQKRAPRDISDMAFENILNFRDVGKTVNRLVGEK